MFICLKGLGKFRKSKAYGLVGCLTLSAVIGLAAPELPVIGGGVVYADVFKVVAIFTMWMFIVNLQRVLL